MKKLHLFLASLAGVGNALSATSLITMSFNSTDGTPVLSAGNPADIISESWAAPGTVVGDGNFVEFNDGSFTTPEGTVTLTTDYQGNAGGFDGTSGIGDPNRVGGIVPGLGIFRDNAGGTNGLEMGQWGTTMVDENNFGLTVEFDQPVVLTDVKTNWWDGGGAEAGSWQITINGSTFAQTDTANENSPVSLAALGFATTTVDGVTGVLLQPGSTILVEDNNVTNTDGSYDNGVLEQLSFYVVPEPSLSALLGLAFAAILLRRRRK